MSTPQPTSSPTTTAEWEASVAPLIFLVALMLGTLVLMSVGCTHMAAGKIRRDTDKALRLLRLHIRLAALKPPPRTG